jgi:hypothetical protein
VVVAYLKILSNDSPGETKKTTENIRSVGVPAENRTGTPINNSTVTEQ